MSHVPKDQCECNRSEGETVRGFCLAVLFTIMAKFEDLKQCVEHANHVH